MTDIDKISQCPACGKCLVIADLIFNVNDQYKTKPFFTKRAYLEIAKAIQIPFFEVYYTTEGKADKAFTKIIGLLRKESRKLNDDDSYELSTKLKAWFNKNVM